MCLPTDNRYFLLSCNIELFFKLYPKFKVDNWIKISSDIFLTHSIMIILDCKNTKFELFINLIKHSYKKNNLFIVIIWISYTTQSLFVCACDFKTCVLASSLLERSSSSGGVAQAYWAGIHSLVPVYMLWHAALTYFDMLFIQKSAYAWYHFMCPG